MTGAFAAFEVLEVLEALGAAAFLVPVPDADGTIVEFRYGQVTEEFTRITGSVEGMATRTRNEGARFDWLLHVFETGEPSISHLEGSDRTDANWDVERRVARCGGGLLLTLRDAADTTLAGLLNAESGGVVVQTDPDGRLLRVSSNCESLFGWTSDELVGVVARELGHPDDAAVVRIHLSSLEDGASRRWEMRLRRKDGSYVWVSVFMRAVLDSDGRIIGRVGHWRDLSEERAKRVALAAGDAERRLVLENSPNVVFHASDGVMEWISPNCSNVLGWSADELIGRSALGGWSTANTSQVDGIRDQMRAAEVGRGRIHWRHRDGHRVWVDVAVRAFERADGTISTVGSMHDVTKEVMALEQLELAVHEFQFLAENASDVVFRGSWNGFADWMSPSVTALTGWSPEEMCVSPFAEFVHPEDVPLLDEVRAEVRANGRGATQLRVRCKDGRYVWVESRIRVRLGDDGNAIGIVGSWRDVSAERVALTELALSEDRFRSAHDSSAVGMAILASDGIVLEVNPAMCRFVGASAEDLVGRRLRDLVGADARDEVAALAAAIVSGTQNSIVSRRRVVRPDGGVGWGDLTAIVLHGADGSIVQVLIEIVDVTEAVESAESLEQAASSLAASEREFRSLLDNSSDAMLRFDRELRVEYVNRRASELAGVPAAEWCGRRLSELGYAPERAELHEAHLARAFSTGEPVVYEFEATTTEGQRWFEGSVAPVRGADGLVSHVVETRRDVTDRVISEAEIAALATHDPLTGLANRLELGDELERAVAAAARSGGVTGVLMIDLDRFKLVNDSRGHDVGDELLREAAERLTRHTRARELVVRQGGDEFIVVMRELDGAAAALAVGWRIVEAFREPFAVGGVELFCTASVGLAVMSGDASATELLRDADTAMYVAKAEGGDRLSVFNAGLRDAVERRVGIEAALRVAIATDELTLWYQPEVDLVTGEVVAAEALLRWNHPDGEVWDAGRFIDIAEDSGLLAQIGAQLLRTACKDAARWTERPIMVRVNLSAHQLNETDLLEVLDDALGSAGLDPRRLCVEITETVLLRTTATVRWNLDGIHNRGIRIASDDFGTGFASLSQLRDHPIDTLKIDRTFVQDLTSDPQSQRLVAATIALAGGMGLHVTAEGVETRQQADRLVELGCPTAQGYLWSPAVPPDQFDKFLEPTFRFGS